MIFFAVFLVLAKVEGMSGKFKSTKDWVKKKVSSNSSSFSPQPLSSSSSSSSFRRPLLESSSFSSSSSSFDSQKEKGSNDGTSSGSKPNQSVGFGQSVEFEHNANQIFLYFQTQCGNQNTQKACEKVTVEHEIGHDQMPFTMTCKWNGKSCSPSDETKQFFGQPLSPPSSPSSLFESEAFSQSSFSVNPSGSKSTQNAQLGHNGNHYNPDFIAMCANKTTQKKCKGVNIDVQNEYGKVVFTMTCEWDDESKSCSPSNATKEYLKISK
ncbi:hypothetical protein niasHT_010889 [Heterodera trifolii]|uniref:Uncharacterized protein n=1 Tax=Heterodera trifolii TaxID=157864 RepID=A0ABD2LIJ2_9BILA